MVSDAATTVINKEMMKNVHCDRFLKLFWAAFLGILIYLTFIMKSTMFMLIECKLKK